MSKTTNYEISKKLAEIGFDKETNFYFTEIAPDKFKAEYYTNNNKYFFLKSYDLETLLDVLPKFIMGSDVSSPEFLTLTKECFSYESYSTFDYIQVDLEPNESLADTAGRLLILLHEKNLIKF
jgi:hypothetical protein